MRPKLTYANVTATLALIIAVGGASAFAATQLPKNSVGSKQLKSNAVTTAKIKDGAVTGSKVNLASLGTVSSASSADNAGHASSADNAAALGGSPASSYVKAGLEPVHVIGEPGEPPFENGAENLTGSEFSKVGFYKDLSGIVHLRGYLYNPDDHKSAFTLPPGFRPQKFELFNGMMAPSEEGELRINSDGKVELINAFQATLGSVMFRTD
jgi:hypothetical protein